MVEVVQAYADWLSQSDVPKLFINSPENRAAYTSGSLPPPSLHNSARQRVAGGRPGSFPRVAIKVSRCEKRSGQDSRESSLAPVGPKWDEKPEELPATKKQKI